MSRLVYMTFMIIKHDNWYLKSAENTSKSREHQ